MLAPGRASWEARGGMVAPGKASWEAWGGMVALGRASWEAWGGMVGFLVGRGRCEEDLCQVGTEPEACCSPARP